MFGRGDWAIVGLVKESLEAFSVNLADPVRMAAASQLAAAAVARLYDSDAMGINPYDAPRLDEQQDLNLDQQTALVVERRVGWPPDALQPPLAQPACGRLEQRLRGFRIVFALEKTKEAQFFAVPLIVGPVVDGRDPPHGLPAAHCQT